MAESATIAEITQMLKDLALGIRHANKLVAEASATSVVNIIGGELEKEINQVGSGAGSEHRRAYLQAVLSEGTDQVDAVEGMIDGLVRAMEAYCTAEVKVTTGSTYGIVADIVGVSLANVMTNCASGAQAIQENTTSITGIASGGSNTGDGMLYASGTSQMCTGDEWRVECQGADAWNAYGEKHGRLNATISTNVTFTDADAGISFQVASGTTPFASGDMFYFSTISDDAGVIQSGLRDRLATVLPASGSPTISDDIAT